MPRRPAQSQRRERALGGERITLQDERERYEHGDDCHDRNDECDHRVRFSRRGLLRLLGAPLTRGHEWRMNDSPSLSACARTIRT
jgi:hypothetical protein